MARAEALALRALAEQLEHAEAAPVTTNIVVPTAASAFGLHQKPNWFSAL
jgi:hypothetical protein